MSDETIYKGNIVAVVLKPGSAPLRCYIGEVQAVDDRGLRITCMDWIIGQFCGLDVFAPWPQITAIQVATEEHSLQSGDGMKQFATWQETMEGAEAQRDNSEV